MPRRYRKSNAYRYKRRKRYTRRRRYKKSNWKLNKLSSKVGFPRQMLVKLNYQDEQTLSGAVVDGHQYKLNSANDFDSTGVGHQPPLYDTLYSATGVYLRNRVYAVKLVLRAFNLAAVPAEIIVMHSDASIAASTVSVGNADVTNSPMTAKTVLGPSGSSRDSCVIHKFFDMRKLIGKKVMTDDDFKHAYNADPTDVQYGLVVASSLDGTTNVNIQYQIDAIMYCRAEELDQSLQVIED